MNTIIMLFFDMLFGTLSMFCIPPHPKMTLLDWNQDTTTVQILCHGLSYFYDLVAIMVVAQT